MFEEMNKELEQLQQGSFRYEKIETMLNQLQQQLGQQEDKEAQYLKELEKEQSDVDKLNHTNLTTIFYTILRSKEEQIEKERQEELAARLMYDNIKNQIEDTKYQISILQAEKKSLEHCKGDYNSLFQKKYQLLLQNDSVNAEKISLLEQNINLIKSNIKEIDEAIGAGNLVMEELLSTEESLDSAEGWGVWDMWGGGGLVTDMIKHSHIDEAKASASQVQTLLNRFRTELADIKISSQITIDIEGFTKFADFFFDGLIADWVVQSHINDSLESVNNVKNEVNNVLSKLQQMKTTNQSNQNQLENELSNLIQKA
jgi:hypothetical protein